MTRNTCRRSNALESTLSSQQNIYSGVANPDRLILTLFFTQILINVTMTFNNLFPIFGKIPWQHSNFRHCYFCCIFTICLKLICCSFFPLKSYFPCNCIFISICVFFRTRLFTLLLIHIVERRRVLV